MITMQLSLTIFISGGPNYTFHNIVKVRTNGSERTSFSPFCNSAANCGAISFFTVSQRKSRCFLNRISRCIWCLGGKKKSVSKFVLMRKERLSCIHQALQMCLILFIYRALVSMTVLLSFFCQGSGK